MEGTAKAEFLRVRASMKTSDNDLKGAEADLLEARKLDPDNLNITLQYANLLWKEGRKDESQQDLYAQFSTRIPTTASHWRPWAISIARRTTRTKAAEYFNRLAKAYPDDYVPYLALGDLYTQTKQFDQAEQNYQKAYQIAPENPLIIANAANAAIEAQQIKLAGVWVESRERQDERRSPRDA